MVHRNVCATRDLHSKTWFIVYVAHTLYVSMNVAMVSYYDGLMVCYRASFMGMTMSVTMGVIVGVAGVTMGEGMKYVWK